MKRRRQYCSYGLGRPRGFRRRPGRYTLAICLLAFQPSFILEIGIAPDVRPPCCGGPVEDAPSYGGRSDRTCWVCAADFRTLADVGRPLGVVVAGVDVPFDGHPSPEQEREPRDVTTRGPPTVG